MARGAAFGSTCLLSFEGAAGRRIMDTFKRKWPLAFLASLVLFAGCAHEYVIRLANGDRVSSRTKPKLGGTYYSFRDQRGEEQVVARKHVVKISRGYAKKQKPEPLSPEDSKQPVELKIPAKPKPPHRHKHWFFLWLR